MKPEVTEALYQELHSSKSYRDFLKAYLSTRGLSLADLARASGFGRSFPSDVLSGKRRLTAKSYYPFERALRLPLAGRKLFRALVALEEHDVFPDMDAAEAARMLEGLRKKPWHTARRQALQNENPGLESLLKKFDVIGIYAAAGKPETGVTFRQMADRTRIDESVLKKCLQSTKEAGLLTEVEDTFFPRELHLFLKTSDRSQLLVELFRTAADLAQQRARIGVTSDKEFFFTSQFCVREDALPELKKALRETMLKFVDESIEPEGDRVVKMVTALHL